MKKALITGGAGFIGINLASHLLSDGYNVILFDNLTRIGSSHNLDWLKGNYQTSRFKVIIADIRDYKAVKEAIKGVDVIYHLASQVAVTKSILNPREDFEVNAAGTLNVLEAVRESGHKAPVVYSSSNKVYGKLTDLPIQEKKNRYTYRNHLEGIGEEQPLDFHSPYGCSKGVGDQYVHDYYRIYGIPTIVFRQSCIYGPHQMGTEDQGWAIHFAISANLNKPLRIYGNGKQVRDLLHVDDLINAYQRAVDNIKVSAGKIYNIGGGRQHSFSLLEYIRFLETISMKEIKVSFSKWRPGDQKIYLSNNKKIQDELGWKPKICHRDGLRQLFKWVEKNRLYLVTNYCFLAAKLQN